MATARDRHYDTRSVRLGVALALPQPCKKRLCWPTAQRARRWSFFVPHGEREGAHQRKNGVTCNFSARNTIGQQSQKMTRTLIGGVSVPLLQRGWMGEHGDRKGSPLRYMHQPHFVYSSGGSCTRHAKNMALTR